MPIPKKLLGLATVGCATVALTVALVFSLTKGKLKVNIGDASSHTLTLNETNAPTGLTVGYQNNFTDTVKTTSGANVQLTFVNAKSFEGGFAELAPRGKIYNYNVSNNEVTAIEGVKFTGSGTLKFKPVITKDDAGGVKGAILADVDPVSFAAGAELTTVPTCDYFEIVAADGGAQIESLEIHYACDYNATDIKLLNGTYTGVGSDSSTYKLVMNNGSGTIQSLDKQSNITLSGTAQMLSKTSVKCTFVYNTYNIYYNFSYDGHSLAYVSKSDDVGGAAASQVATISLDRVYNVEDFESYSASGQGYTNSTTKYQTSGLRAEIYADYYTGSSTGEIGGSGWPVMTSTDNTTLLKTKGHNGQGGAFKFSNGTGMRYISMNSLYGVKSRVGKGSVLSFWARGAYTNTYFDTNHASNTSMKMYAYYDTPLTPSNQTTVRESWDFTVNAGNTWQHFEMPLTAGRNYYGFGFFAQQSSGSTQYVPFDDFQIYTASPYAEYVAPVAATGVSVSPTAVEVVAGNTTQLTATVAPADATNKAVAWSSSNTSVATVSSTGLVTGVTTGNATITVTTDDGGYTATCAVTVVAPSANYPEGTFKGTATVLGANYAIVIAFGNQSNGLIGVRLANKDAVATGVTYNSSTHQFTITTTGDYSGYSYGNITGTYDVANDQLTGISCSGSISAGVSNNGSITATRPTAAQSFSACDGTTSELQAQFKRRYGDPWTVDTKNTDRITSNTTQFVSGTGSLKLRAWNGGRIALNFQNDFSPAKQIQNVQFWVYNSSANDITLRMWYYQGTNFSSNGETDSVTAKANGWTYVAMGFGSGSGDGNRTVYNFQIADFTSSNVALSFDNIYLF